jgi:hypothetical protein
VTVHREDLARAVADGAVPRAQADALRERTGAPPLPAPLRRLLPPRAR